MELKEIRAAINEIDSEMKSLYEKRMNCSQDVAAVKMRDNRAVYQPAREKEILARYPSDDTYPLFLRKVMQISRRHQYRQFLKEDDSKEEFSSFLGEEKTEQLLREGKISFGLTEDEYSEKGLSKREVLSLLADFDVDIITLFFEGHRLNVSLDISKSKDREEAFFEVYLLMYMLYFETLDFEIL